MFYFKRVLLQKSDTIKFKRKLKNVAKTEILPDASFSKKIIVVEISGD